jgi:hypothetical protein
MGTERRAQAAAKAAAEGATARASAAILASRVTPAYT